MLLFYNYRAALFSQWSIQICFYLHLAKLLTHNTCIVWQLEFLHIHFSGKCVEYVPQKCNDAFMHLCYVELTILPISCNRQALCPVKHCILYLGREEMSTHTHSQAHTHTHTHTHAHTQNRGGERMFCK